MQRVITLIDKGKERTLIKNWRPISLLNTDYKIASKSIANRFKHLLPKLVHHNQTGFIENRNIQENLRVISNIFYFTKEYNIPGFMISLDFKKAFDSLEHNFLDVILKKFNFGPSLCGWIRDFYNNISSCILNAGSTSPYFSIERGVRQGDPLSPYLFVLSLEMLAILIRDEPNINGIQSHEVEIKLSLYADDVTGFLGDELSGHKFIEIVNMFGKFSGLELNMEKIMAKWLGLKRNSVEKPLLISWPDNPIKMLGICFSYDEQECNTLNYESKINKIRQIIYRWRERDLTLIGRIQIIKTFIISQFQHIISVIDIPELYIKQIETIIYNFVWNEKRDKIKRSTLRKRKELGGLKAPDFRCIIQAAKLKWLFMLLNPDGKPWKSLCINCV